jgi:hypothetical protein
MSDCALARSSLSVTAAVPASGLPPRVVSRGMFTRLPPRHAVTTQALGLPTVPGPATPAKGACPCDQPATTRATATDAGPVIASVLIALAFAAPLLILGLAALIRGRPEDMPAIMHALARGAEAGTVPGGPAIVVAAESVQAAGPGSNRNPLPAGQRAYYDDRPGSLKISSGT